MFTPHSASKFFPLVVSLGLPILLVGASSQLEAKGVAPTEKIVIKIEGWICPH